MVARKITRTTKTVVTDDYSVVAKAVNDYLRKYPGYIFEGSNGERNPDGTTTQTLRFYRLIDK